MGPQSPQLWGAQSIRGPEKTFRQKKAICRKTAGWILSKICMGYISLPTTSGVTMGPQGPQLRGAQSVWGPEKTFHQKKKICKKIAGWILTKISMDVHSPNPHQL